MIRILHRGPNGQNQELGDGLYSSSVGGTFQFFRAVLIFFLVISPGLDFWRFASLGATNGGGAFLGAVLRGAEPVVADRPVSMVNDVMPVLTKHGCNAGTCHAKAGGGQRGFQLSLLGFEPAEDYQHLVIEGRGRRLALNAPEQSLLLLKGAGLVPHGGGAKLPVDSEAFRTLAQWIRQGATYDGQTAPKLTSVTVEPTGGVVPMRSEHRLRVTAAYADGTQRDVTSLALFESNDTAMATVDETGVVRATAVGVQAKACLRSKLQK